MSTTSDLELQGSLHDHPIVEVIVEIAAARLSGSLKISSANKKAIVYFGSGIVLFTVSNERAFRLLEFLLADGAVDRQFLNEVSNAPNDLELAERIVSAKRLSVLEMNKVVRRQCESIVAALIEWTEGGWTYSPHSRLRSDIEHNLDVRRPMIEYSRKFSPDAVAKRFKSMNEWFVANAGVNGIELQPHEAFVLSRFDNGQLTIGQLVALGGLSQTASMHAVYCLWIAGFLTRHGGNPAFPEHRISQL
ncbi:MAG TPA: DUF4388 domain-containing protein, partial [Pyrinomonadaceae bacterium]